MTKKISVGFVIAIVAIAIAITFAVTYNVAMSNFNKKVIDLNQRQQMYTKLSNVDQEVRTNFYKDIDDTTITNGTIEGYIDSLNDSQSEYLTKEEYKTQQDNQNKIDANDVTSSVIGNNIGYVKIDNFTSGTDARLQTALTNLQNDGVKGIVIDLRNNPGENVNSAVESANLLINSGDLLSLQYKDGNKELVKSADTNSTTIPVNVVVNENTSLGAEIFAKDIKDTNRGKVIGTKTAGIGTKTQFYPLSDGSAIKLSVATYITNDGSAFNGIGVEPNINTSLAEDKQKQFNEGTLSLNDDTVIQEAQNQL